MEQSQNASDRLIQEGQNNENVISLCLHCNEREVETEVADFEKSGKLNPFCNICIEEFGNREEKQDVYVRFGIAKIFQTERMNQWLVNLLKNINNQKIWSQILHNMLITDEIAMYPYNINTFK